MRVFVLGTGSSGNALLVQSGASRVLVDAGVGPRAMVKRLRALGEDLFPRGVDAVVVTHQHGDHIAHLEPLARALGCPIYLHSGIEAKRVRHRFEVVTYDPGERLAVGGLALEALDVPHDAPQVALRISDGALTFGLATDLGWVPGAVVRFLAACDVAFVEANHDERMLAEGPYPPKLKRRVGGAFGHLNNEQTAELAGRLVGTRVRRLVLGHLSRTNNEPRVALDAVRRGARGLAVDVVPHGDTRALDLARAPSQLPLFPS